MFGRQLADYRDFALGPSLRLDSPHLLRLWSFQCAAAADRMANGMAWNSLNKDMLAVGYLPPRGSAAPDGLLLVWTVKNPLYPERLIRTHSGVMCCAFSEVYPNLLAVGLVDGTVALYDVRTEDAGTPILASAYVSCSEVWSCACADCAGGIAVRGQASIWRRCGRCCGCSAAGRSGLCPLPPTAVSQNGQ